MQRMVVAALAARKLNLSQVPVIVLDHLSETQKRLDRPV